MSVICIVLTLLLFLPLCVFMCGCSSFFFMVLAFLKVLLIDNVHVDGMGFWVLIGLSFSMVGVLLGLLYTSLISYTRVYGLCRGRYSDIFIIFVWFCCVRKLLICFLSTSLMNAR